MLDIYYNLRVGRSEAQVAREVRALTRKRKVPGGRHMVQPRVVAGCEGAGYTKRALPDIPGYRLIRDRSNKSRANIWAYVWDRDTLSGIHWEQMHETWGRTDHPGEHEARAWLKFVRDGQLYLIGHQPPKYTDNTLPAQREGIEYLVGEMAPWIKQDYSEQQRAKLKARVVKMMADMNRGPRETGPGPKELATRVDGVIVGQTIDMMVGRLLEVLDVELITEVRIDDKTVVPMLSDHDHAVAFWTRPKKLV